MTERKLTEEGKANKNEVQRAMKRYNNDKDIRKLKNLAYQVQRGQIGHDVAFPMQYDVCLITSKGFVPIERKEESVPVKSQGGQQQQATKKIAKIIYVKEDGKGKPW